MITHNELGPASFRASRRLKRMIDNGEIRVAGNRKLKIYGRLSCRSGKRMKRSNRVFFTDEREAVANGYRPCGHCMPEEYRRWKLR